MEPSHQFLAILEIPSPVQMPNAIRWQRPFSLLKVGEASMHPSANAFISKALVKFKSQDHARGQGPSLGCLQISLLYDDLCSSLQFSWWKLATFECWLQGFQQQWSGLPHICLAPPWGGLVLCSHRQTTGLFSGPWVCRAKMWLVEYC